MGYRMAYAPWFPTLGLHSIGAWPPSRSARSYGPIGACAAPASGGRGATVECPATGRAHGGIAMDERGFGHA